MRVFVQYCVDPQKESFDRTLVREKVKHVSFRDGIFYFYYKDGLVKFMKQFHVRSMSFEDDGPAPGHSKIYVKDTEPSSGGPTDNGGGGDGPLRIA